MYVTASLYSWNHIHPVLVHFSTALVPASVVSDALARYFDRRSLAGAAWWMMLYGAIATPLTAFAGWMWASEFTASASQHLPELGTHMWLGFSLVLGFSLLALWRGKIFFRSGYADLAYLSAGGLVIAALMYQGFLGGQMTMG